MAGSFAVVTVAAGAAQLFLWLRLREREWGGQDWKTAPQRVASLLFPVSTFHWDEIHPVPCGMRNNELKCSR